VPGGTRATTATRSQENSGKSKENMRIEQHTEREREKAMQWEGRCGTIKSKKEADQGRQ